MALYGIFWHIMALNFPFSFVSSDIDLPSRMGVYGMSGSVQVAVFDKTFINGNNYRASEGPK